MRQEFSRLGLAPGNPDGTYIQRIPMFGIVSTTRASFEVGGRTLTPAVRNVARVEAGLRIQGAPGRYGGRCGALTRPWLAHLLAE